MLKIKAGLIIFAILFVVITVIGYNARGIKIANLKADNERLTANNFNLLQDNQANVNLVIRESELSGKIKKSRDSIAELLKVKPKYIDRIIYIDNYIHDTTKVTVYVQSDGLDRWKVRDSSTCFKWSGIALKQGDNLNITRTNYESLNTITQTFYKKRPYKFIIPFGKFQYFQKITSTCGENTYKSIIFVK